MRFDSFSLFTGRRKKITDKKSGFTLVELLFVVAIITLVASVVLTYTSQARMRARDAKRLVEKGQIRKALEFYATDRGVFPKSASLDLEGFILSEWSCFAAPSSESCWRSSFTGLDSLASALQSYFVSGIPRPNAVAGSFAYNTYLYTTDHPGWSDTKGDHPSGTYLIWPKEQEITASECNPNFIYRHDETYWYCYEWLGE